MKATAKYLSNSQAYSEYVGKMAEFVANGQTSGPEQSETRIHFTKMNLSRMHRWGKLLQVTPDAVPGAAQLSRKYRLLAITESWCGDAAHCLPVIQKICELSPNLSLFTIWRDEYPELIDAYLTNGSRSIPKVLIIDEDDEVVNVWGPRPEPTLPILQAYKSNPEISHDDFVMNLQQWYNQDKGKSLITEWNILLSQLS